MDHSSTQDLEKSGEAAHVNVTSHHGNDIPGDYSSSDHEVAPTPNLLKGRLALWNDKVEGLSGLEARGIKRVLPDEKIAGGLHAYIHMFLLWLSMNLVALDIITGLLGPLLFALGWVDSVCIVVFANLIAACGPGYTSTFGPISGCRTMGSAELDRFVMGYWPSKIVGVLALIQNIGFGIIGCIVAGQMISAVNGAGLTVAVGSIIAAVLIAIVAIFGIKLVHMFERYSFIIQAFAILILMGVSHKDWDASAVSMGPSGTITANRCSFFAVIFASTIGFAAISADFSVYYPVETSRPLTFLMTWSATFIAIVWCNLVGVGIGTGVAANQTWSDAYEISSGALILIAYEGLGRFGGFCVVILALGSVTNNAPSTYSAANTFQALGRYTKAIRRWFWCVVIFVIELVCSVAGRNSLFAVFQNFLPVMSYWVCPFLTSWIEESILLRTLRRNPFDWTLWEGKKQLPIGAAALFAFLCGWAGAIVGMYQVWNAGPIAIQIGGYGGDIGAWLSIVFCGVVFPPLRYLELKKFGR